MIHLIFRKFESYNFKINVIPKGVEKYISLGIKQTKEVIIDCGIPIAGTDLLKDSLNELGA